jgi:TatD DNase family protein
MTLIDTHAHIYLPEFRNDMNSVMERAGTEGVTKVFMPAIDSYVIDDMLKTEADFPEVCFAMMGLHPCSVKDGFKSELDLVLQWLEKRRFAAVGEIGLDFYWDKTHVQEQYTAFETQIRWALEFDLPIVIHSRDSGNECLETVKKFQDGRLKGIFHCFSGQADLAKGIIDAGFYLGIGGVITYKNAGLAEALKEVALDRMVLETDAPYLTPVPFRGKRNESSYLKYVVEKLAMVKEVSVEEVAAVTTANAEKIFAP